MTVVQSALREAQKSSRKAPEIAVHPAAVIGARIRGVEAPEGAMTRAEEEYLEDGRIHPAEALSGVVKDRAGAAGRADVENANNRCDGETPGTARCADTNTPDTAHIPVRRLARALRRRR